MTKKFQRQDGEAVAIIGLAGRFPGAHSVAEYWRNLCNGVESLTVFSNEQLLDAGVTAAQWSNPNYVRAGGIVEDADCFDAQFFGLNPREAEIIDPQQRVFLECAWEALEDAGYDPAMFAGDIGLFAGAGLNTYSVTNLFLNPGLIDQVGLYQVMLGNDKDFLATRVAYKLNLKGPAVSVQTACSTSLVAVQMAFESLLRGECDMALAGGVSIHFPQQSGYLYMPGMILSPDGHCRAFDARAAGTVPGRGAGLVILRRLSDAVAAGDQIYAVIRGAAINNDGAAKVGYSAPSVEGQSRVIAKSMEMAGFAPASVSYIEAHGTGTEVGDPIEITALNEIFGQAGYQQKSCAIGSVKTNIGHLDTAAGVAGLIKAALAIKHRIIPPTLHFERPNPHIDFDRTPFFVNSEVLHYEKSEPFRVGVSSFGIGGTNAHVSLEEAPKKRVNQAGASEPMLSQLMVFSARSEVALEAQTAAVLTYFEENPEASLSDIAFTLQTGRRSFRYRRSFVASDLLDAASALKSPSSLRMFSGTVENEQREFAFLFPGQGSQYVNMGRGLYETVAVFRHTVDYCAQQLEPYVHLDLRTVLYPTRGEETEAEELLRATSVTQPALFVVEYAMAQAWLTCGIHPNAMLGHSVGEYVAACLAGVFSLDDALRLIAVRGRLVQSAEPGAMLAVSLDEGGLIAHLESNVSIAAVNSPGQAVVSGPFDAISRLEALMSAQAVECKRLRTSHAFHSAMLDPILEAFRDAFTGVSLHTPSLPYLSNLTGTWITPDQATDPMYWVSHLRGTVRFSDCAKQLSANPGLILLEVGPGETLLSLLRQDRRNLMDFIKIGSIRAAWSVQDDYQHWLESIGRIWLAGGRPDWQAIHASGRPHRISLPTYPFERQRYWVELANGHDLSHSASDGAKSAQSAALLKQPDIADWFYVPSWKRLTPFPLSYCSPLADGNVGLFLAQEGNALTDELSSAIEPLGRIVKVFPGERFEQHSENRYHVAPGNRDHWSALIKHLLADGLWPERVVHAWTFSQREVSGARSPSASELNQSLDVGFFSVMFLAQAIGDASSVRRVDFKIITAGTRSVAGEFADNLAAAPLISLCRVIPLEYPNIRCGVVDVGEIDHSRGLAAYSNQLAREVLSDSSNTILALRSSARWQEHYEPVRFEKDIPRQLRVVEGGVYLITGGLGGFGLVFAEYLARTAHAHLVLTSRSDFFAEAEWEDILQDESAPKETKDRIRRLQNVIVFGGKVTILVADTSDAVRMHEVVLHCREHFGAIHGIIHAAGLPSFSMIQVKSQPDALAVLSPKVHGIGWIHEYLGAPDLDFVLLCSSISAVVASYGLSDYAAANAYLDAFATAFDRSTATRVISVNWDTWSEVGMAVELAKVSNSPAITVQEAEQVFERVLGCPVPQVVVSTRDLQAVLKTVAAELGQVHELVQSRNRNRAVASHPRPNLSQPYAAPIDQVEVAVVEIWRELLGIESIGRHDNFFELGGHSLLGTQVIARLRTQFGLDLPLRTVFEAATPAELAEILRTIPWAFGSNSSAAMEMDREEIEI
jgi:acyl transferase domain-containing protein